MKKNNRKEIKNACRDDWKIEPMPEMHETFELSRPLTNKETEALRRGYIPETMDDRWFMYMEGDTLFAHRSWTGRCIFKVDFKEDGHHVVTVNRDPVQYGCNDIEEDIDTLNGLLDWLIDAAK